MNARSTRSSAVIVVAAAIAGWLLAMPGKAEETQEPVFPPEESVLPVEPDLEEPAGADPLGQLPNELPPLRGVDAATEAPTPEEGIEIPPAPPAFVAPADADVPPSPSAEDLAVPQSPLQIRISRTQGLSLDDALQLALDNNPDIELARLAVESLFEAVREVRAEYTPQVSSQAQYTISRPSELRGVNNDLLSMSLRASYVFFDGGGRNARNRVADSNLEIARDQLALTTQSVRLSVAESYYSLQLADAQVQIAEAAIANSEANLRDTEAQFRAGIGTRFEVLQAETELATDRQDLLRAENDQLLARRRLAELLNFDSPTDAIATDAIEPTQAWEQSLEDTILAAFQNREELEIQRDAFARAQQQAQLALAARRPRIEGFVDYEVSNVFSEPLARVGFVDGYSVGFTISWLAIDGGATDARARQADIDALDAIRTFERDRNDIRRSVEDAFLSLSSNREQIEVAQLAISTARESLRLARLRFQAGVGTQTDVISQQTALTQARANLADAVIGYNLAIVQLERAVSSL
ncbi:MAG: TolC family protein [Cyanobacteria bacterium J06639_1]